MMTKGRSPAKVNDEPVSALAAEWESEWLGVAVGE